MADPCDQLDRGVGLGVSGLPERCHCAIKDLAPFSDRGFALAAELAEPVHALPIPRRHGVSQCRLSNCHGGRYARGPRSRNIGHVDRREANARGNGKNKSHRPHSPSCNRGGALAGVPKPYGT